jgi:hypothetical protein
MEENTVGGSRFYDHFAGGGSRFMRKVGLIYVIKNIPCSTLLICDCDNFHFLP